MSNDLSVIEGDFEVIMTTDYYKIQRLSNSGMGALAKSPAHYQEYLKSDFDTPAMRFGRLVHTAILEPAMLNIAPFEGDRRKKEGKAEYAALLESGKDAVSGDEYESIIRMSDNVLATGLIKGDFEVPMLWQDADSGALCKGKADIIDAASGMIWDIKTTGDATDFAYSVRKYEYDRQAAFYLDGAAQCGFGVTGFGWIVVEKTAPFGVQIYVASPETIATGRAKYKPLCAIYAECSFTGEWHSYSSVPIII
jgi:exodeoxyribonuclease VIII